MPNYMKGTGKGYIPPSGSAGGKAHGEYSTKKNPLSVPMKGSQIGSSSQFGDNADRAKVKKLQSEQARAESLRGYGC